MKPSSHKPLTRSEVTARIAAGESPHPIAALATATTRNPKT